MTFSEVDQRYQELKQQRLAGTLTDEQFDDALHELMVQDAEGRWWAKSRETGEWHYYDAVTTNWVRAEPPETDARAAAAPPPTSTQEYTAPPQPGSAAEPAASSPAAPDANDALPRWASRTPQPPEKPAPASEAAPVVRPRNPAANAFGPVPELGTAMKVVFYLLSFLIPLVGLILFFIYRNKPAQQDRSAARTFLILGIVSLLLSCLCTVAYGSLAAWLMAVPST